MNWLDLGIIILFVVLLIISIKRGFMTSVLSHFSFGMNAFISFFLYRPIQMLLNVCHLGEAITTHYSTVLIEKSSNFAVNLFAFDSAEALNSFVGTTINEGGFNGLSKLMFKWFLNKKSLFSTLHESNLTSRTLAEIISESYSNFFTVIISFIISMLLIYLIVFIFRIFVEKLRKNGFIKAVDNTLGIVYGVFRCFVIFIIVFSIIKLMSPFHFMSPVIDYINSSLFGKLIFAQISNFIDNYLGFGDIIKSIIK